MDINITVKQGGQVIATGTLAVDTSTNPQTGTFTPTGGSAVTCTNVFWSSVKNTVVHFTFTLTSANGQFPVPSDPSTFTYSFTGTENATGTQANGHVPWPQNHPTIEGDDNATWQGEAAGEEPYAQGQGAS